MTGMRYLQIKQIKLIKVYKKNVAYMIDLLSVIHKLETILWWFDTKTDTS